MILVLAFFAPFGNGTKAHTKGAKAGKESLTDGGSQTLSLDKALPMERTRPCFLPMNTNSQNGYTENQLSKIILDAAFKVHTKSGPGMLETFYEFVLAHELPKQGLQVERQVPIRIYYDELVFDEGFRADLLVAGKVIVELRSVEELARVHSKQVLTQLRLSHCRLGLLINFGEVNLKNGIERIVNGLPEEPASGIGRKLASFFASLASLV